MLNICLIRSPKLQLILCANNIKFSVKNPSSIPSLTNTHSVVDGLGTGAIIGIAVGAGWLKILTVFRKRTF